MKKSAFLCMAFFSVLILTGCEKKILGDNAKIQEAVDKIKTKIQETFTDDPAKK